MTDIDKRLSEIEARCAAIPDFMGIPKSQGAGGWLLSHDGHRTYAETHTAEMHEYTAHAYGDQRWLVALVRRYRQAMVGISAYEPLEDSSGTYNGQRITKSCGWCSQAIEYVEHLDSCPWRIARESTE